MFGGIHIPHRQLGERGSKNHNFTSNMVCGRPLPDSKNPILRVLPSQISQFFQFQAQNIFAERNQRSLGGVNIFSSKIKAAIFSPEKNQSQDLLLFRKFV